MRLWVRRCTECICNLPTIYIHIYIILCFKNLLPNLVFSPPPPPSLLKYFFGNVSDPYSHNFGNQKLFFLYFTIMFPQTPNRQPIHWNLKYSQQIHHWRCHQWVTNFEYSRHIHERATNFEHREIERAGGVELGLPHYPLLELPLTLKPMTKLGPPLSFLTVLCHRRPLHVALHLLLHWVCHQAWQNGADGFR